MFAWYRRLRDVAQTLQGIEERLDGLDHTTTDQSRTLSRFDDDLDHLAHQLKRLRGRITGGVRKVSEVERGEDDVEEINRQIRDGTFDKRHLHLREG